MYHLFVPNHFLADNSYFIYLSKKNPASSLNIYSEILQYIEQNIVSNFTEKC